jgi:carbon storage regulator CsrA
MLVLSRKKDESIVIGDNIIVKVISVENGTVKLGIEAPRDVSIIRNELIEEVTAMNKAAVKETTQEERDSLSEMFSK